MRGFLVFFKNGEFFKFLIFLTFISLSGAAVATAAAADTINADQRFEGLIKDLRCMTCPNQNLADSNTPIAIELKTLIQHKIQAGESDAAIKAVLVAEHGDYILYDPPFKKETWCLWLAPGLLAGVVLMVVVRRSAF